MGNFVRRIADHIGEVPPDELLSGNAEAILNGPVASEDQAVCRKEHHRFRQRVGEVEELIRCHDLAFNP
jgi:hypothetical protein